MSKPPKARELHHVYEKYVSAMDALQLAPSKKTAKRAAEMRAEYKKAKKEFEQISGLELGDTPPSVALDGITPPGPPIQIFASPASPAEACQVAEPDRRSGGASTAKLCVASPVKKKYKRVTKPDGVIVMVEKRRRAAPRSEGEKARDDSPTGMKARTARAKEIRAATPGMTWREALSASWAEVKKA